MDIQGATQGVNDWSNLALLIGISEADYRQIVDDNRNDGRRQQRQIITSWLKAGKASWAILAAALRNPQTNMAWIGNAIAKDHPSKAQPPAPG